MTKEIKKEDLEKELIEKWADIEHRRWANWQKYMHSKMKRSYDFTTYNLPENLYKRWERQIATDYKDLSEKEKESDREQVYPYLVDIKSLLGYKIKEIEKNIAIEISKVKIEYPEYESDGYDSGCKRTLEVILNLPIFKENDNN